MGCADTFFVEISGTWRDGMLVDIRVIGGVFLWVLLDLYTLFPALSYLVF